MLAACGGTQTSAGNFRNGGGRSRPLTPEAKLALGTIRLDGTAQAIDPDHAAQLLPLWQLLAQLNGSTSAAPQEITAVVDQIRATMSAEQVKAIDGMQLTSNDVIAAFQQERQASGTGGNGNGFAGRSSSDPAPSSSGSRRNQGGQNFFFAGGGPPGGFGGGFGNNGGTRTNGAQSQNGSSGNSSQTAQSFSNATTAILVNQVIQLLENRIKT
jgi:hypothetical protein